MYKKVFKSGDIITPEFLNELQNLSFEKSPDEVGGLPVFVILVDSKDADAANYPYLKDKFIAAGKTADNSYGQDVGFDVVETRGGHRIIGIIENKAVTTDKLADDAVTKEKIARGAVSNGCLADKSVSTEKLMDSSVSREKIANGAVSADKLDSTELFTATGWIAFINDSNFAQYRPTSMTLNAKTSTSVAKTAGFRFSNGGFTCYADVGSFGTLSANSITLNGENLETKIGQIATEKAASARLHWHQSESFYNASAGKWVFIDLPNNPSSLSTAHLQLKLSRFGKDLTTSAAFYKFIDAEGNLLENGDGFLGADGGRVATKILNSSDYTTATMLVVGINTTDDFSGTVSLSQYLSNQ